MARPKPPEGVLTPSEVRVMDQLATGCSITECANALGLAVTTVRKRLESIRVKLGVGATKIAVARWRSKQERPDAEAEQIFLRRSES